MSTTVTVLAVAGALAVSVIVIAAWLTRRRRRKRNARRIAALRAVAERIDAAVTSVCAGTGRETAEQRPAPTRAASAAPAPRIADGLPGRAALLDAVADAVEHARVQGARLSAAVVRVTGEKDAGALAGVAHEVAHAEAYAVGPRAVALVLPGLGRADALGVLARIEAQCASSGRALELEPREDAIEFAARLLAGRVGSVPEGD